MDLLLCSVWLLFTWHDNCWAAWLLMLPPLRIWLSFTMHRNSKWSVVPLCVITIFLLIQVFGLGYDYWDWFWNAFVTMTETTVAIFGGDVISVRECLTELSDGAARDAVNLVGSLWLLVIPAIIMVYRWWKGQLQPMHMGWREAVRVAIYTLLLIIVVLVSKELGRNFVLMTLGICAIIGLMRFYKGDLKALFTRTEIFYLCIIGLLGCCYSCGVELHKNGNLMLYATTLACYALTCWYFSGKKCLSDMLLLTLGTTLFWISPTTMGMVRIMLLFVSLACVSAVCIRLSLALRKVWVGALMFSLMGIVLPLLSMGYNPYAAIDCKVTHRYNKYSYGVLAVESKDGQGLRDRYGIIMPTVYDCIEDIAPGEPYIKGFKDTFFQIYDIDAQNLLSEEWFYAIEKEPDSRCFYLLKSVDGDKRFWTPHWDAGICEMVDAKIVELDSTFIEEERPTTDSLQTEERRDSIAAE